MREWECDHSPTRPREMGRFEGGRAPARRPHELHQRRMTRPRIDITRNFSRLNFRSRPRRPASRINIGALHVRSPKTLRHVGKQPGQILFRPIHAAPYAWSLESNERHHTLRFRPICLLRAVDQLLALVILRTSRPVGRALRVLQRRLEILPTVSDEPGAEVFEPVVRRSAIHEIGHTQAGPVEDRPPHMGVRGAPRSNRRSHGSAALSLRIGSSTRRWQCCAQSRRPADVLGTIS